jgi:hypothetical protein
MGVFTAAKLFNGRTVFSDNRPSQPRVPIGAVVIDDAHAVMNTLRFPLSVSIGRLNPAFKELLDPFADDLKEEPESSEAPGRARRFPVPRELASESGARRP